MAYQAVIFDLFGTVVHFDAAVPSVNVAGTEWRTTMGWLRERLAADLPAVPFERFLAAVVAVTEEIVRGRPPEYLEVASEERFRRTLERLGRCGGGAQVLAGRLCAAHMEYLASRTSLPAENRALLTGLGGRVRTAILSNFDHGPTFHAILRRDGIDELVDVAVVSAEFGRRKPHPAIFHETLRLLDVAARDALYVGDTLADDVEGALGAGMNVAWLAPAGKVLPGGAPRPTHRIATLADVEALIAGG